MEEDDVNGKPSNISSNGPVGSQSIANIKKKKKQINSFAHYIPWFY